MNANRSINKKINPRELQARMKMFIDASQYLIDAMAKLHINSLPTWVLNPETGELKKIVDERMSDMERRYQELIALLHKRIVVDDE